MFTPKLCVVLPPADRAQLADVLANGNTPQKLAVRARILVLLAARVRPWHIATRLALSRTHVHYWMRRYVAQGGRERRAARCTSARPTATDHT
jgi:Homeodomain-like domain